MSASAAESAEVERRTLDNGVLILYEHRSTPPVIAVRVFVPAGSAADPEGKEGVARLTAQLLSSQTDAKSLVEFSRYVDDHGMKVSASVQPDFTVFSFTATAEFRRELLGLIREVLTNPSFDTDALERLRTQQRARLSQRKDRSFTFAYDEALKVFYRGHPYQHPESGLAETLPTLTAADCRRFFERHYSTGSLVISSVGDLTLDQLSDLGEGLSLPAQDGRPRLAPLENPPSDHRIHSRSIDQPTHLLLYPAPSVQDTGYVRTKVLNALLGGGMGSLLFSEIREKRSMGYQVGSLYPSRRSTSHLMIYLGGGDTTGESFREALDPIVERLAREGPTDEELEQAREHLKGQFLLDHEQPGQTAWYRGFYEIMRRGADFDNRYPRLIDAVQAEDVRQAAARLLRERDPFFFTLRPEAAASSSE